MFSQSLCLYIFFTVPAIWTKCSLLCRGVPPTHEQNMKSRQFLPTRQLQSSIPKAPISDGQHIRNVILSIFPSKIANPGTEKRHNHVSLTTDTELTITLTLTES